jgi:hypothetical protein
MKGDKEVMSDVLPKLIGGEEGGLKMTTNIL